VSVAKNFGVVDVRLPATDRLGRARDGSAPDAGCHESPTSEVILPESRPPVIIFKSPSSGSRTAAGDALIYVTLYPKSGEAIVPASVTSSSFYVTDQNGYTLPVAGLSVGALAAGFQDVILNVDGTLYPLATYTAHLTSGIVDGEGSALAATAWSFAVIGPAGPAVLGAVGPSTGTASHTMSSPWPAGTTVSVFRRAEGVPANARPAGPVVASGVVDAASIVSFTGLDEGLRYVAWANGLGVAFLVPAPIYRVVRVA
jgi:hypothetical protein